MPRTDLRGRAVDPALPPVQALPPLLRAAAREELLPRFRASRRVTKADGSVVTAADLAVQERLRADLAARWPGIGFLGEEMSAAAQDAALEDSQAPVWCLDPLDATTNFAAGVPVFCISLALIAGGRTVAAAIYDPVLDECFTAAPGTGAWCNDTPLRAHPPGVTLSQCVAGVDLKRLEPALAARIAAQGPYASQRNFGSAVLDWCWVAAGRLHVYLHGGQKLWDLAAGSLVLEEAGGYACTLDGAPVFRAQTGARSVVAALDPALFRAWCAWLGVVPHQPPAPAADELKEDGKTQRDPGGYPGPIAG